MKSSIAAAVVAQSSNGWVKNAAKATFLLVFIKGTVWVAATWLAMRGFPGM